MSCDTTQPITSVDSDGKDGGALSERGGAAAVKSRPSTNLRCKRKLHEEANHSAYSEHACFEWAWH